MILSRLCRTDGFLAAVVALAAMSAARAETTPCNDGWRFHLDDAAGASDEGFDDQAWPVVALPHTPRLEARVTSQEHPQWEGVCWYRRTIELPRSAVGQTVWLRFEGAMNVAEVYVNGAKRAASIDGYTPFVADLTPEARDGKPIHVAVRLDNRHSDVTGPKPLPVLDFQTYGGLYRGVSLIVKPAIHITDEMLENRPASGGVFVTYPQVSQAEALVLAKVHVRHSGGPAKQIVLVGTVSEFDGTQVAQTMSAPVELAGGEERVVTVEIPVKHPRLWSPRDPHLYRLDASLLVEGRVVDSQPLRIGVRRFSVGPGAIVINGRSHRLRGVNRHQEYPYVGNAVPANAQYRDALKIKRAGFDFVRLSHYPQAPEFMDACDELGLVVLDSILGWQFNAGTPAFMDNRVAAARALIRRDRNHASAMLWELSLNETPMTPEFIARLNRAGHEEYPGDQGVTAGWVDGYDVKFTARQHGSTKEFARAGFPCLVSEYGDWEYYAGNAGFNQQAWGNLKQAERNSRQARGDGEVRLLQQATNLQEAHNENLTTRVFADAYWVMFDYNRGYANDLETSGIMDLFRLPKLSHAFFASQRDADDVLPGRSGGALVKIASWWTPASPLRVRVFSNCDEVELFLNDRSLGRQKPDRDRMSTALEHPPFTFAVARFEPGELRAIGYLSGTKASEDVVRTPGEPARLEVAVDVSGRPASAGGDLLFVYAKVVDAAGTVVPTVNPAAQFTIEGDGAILGDNPSAAEAGIAAALLKTGDKPGRIVIRATSGRLSGEQVLQVTN